MRPWSIVVALAASCLNAAIPADTAQAAEISLMTTGAVEYILRDLTAPFERATGHKVTMTVLGTGPAVAKIKEGTFADMILLGPPALMSWPRRAKSTPARLRRHFTRASASRCGRAQRSPTSARLPR
jgi:ABC-type molybdate transport system substrate-binding protein